MFYVHPQNWGTLLILMIFQMGWLKPTNQYLGKMKIEISLVFFLWKNQVGGFKYFLFSPPFGEMIQFD